jgi:hypothetical protein
MVRLAIFKGVAGFVWFFDGAFVVNRWWNVVSLWSFVVVIVAVKDVARFLDLFFGFCRSPGHPQFRSNGQKRLFGLWG